MFESHRRSRRWLLRVPTLLIIAGVMLLIPGVVLAAGTFTDDDASVFEEDIEWLAAAGVTRGCNPPTSDRFCPDDPVTRGQMAAFMHRLSENRVVDAKTAAVADQAETAADADLLDGKDSIYTKRSRPTPGTSRHWWRPPPPP
jgi:hypothetical protein